MQLDYCELLDPVRAPCLPLMLSFARGEVMLINVRYSYESARLAHHSTT